MKKIALLMVAALMTGAAVAQTTVEEKAPQAPKTTEIANLQLAHQLAKYGYEAESPTALIEAARIIVETPKQQLEAEYTQGQGKDAESPTGRKQFSPGQLLADARSMADGDQAVLALADQVNPDVVTRGAVGGPKYTQTYVYAYATDSYTVRFYRNQLAEVAISGDGDTDLDLYIYDENGNLIDSDVDYSDDCYVRCTPKWTGRFYIKVVNRGPVRNYYTLVTN